LAEFCIFVKNWRGMAQTITLSLTPKQAADSKFYTSAVAKQLGVKQSDIALLRIVKRSVDARRNILRRIL